MNRIFYSSDTVQVNLAVIALNNNNNNNNARIEIEENNILIKDNHISINSDIVIIYELIYLYYNNTCNTIMQNNSLIMNNCIEGNGNYGIYIIKGDFCLILKKLGEINIY